MLYNRCDEGFFLEISVIFELCIFTALSSTVIGLNNHQDIGKINLSVHFAQQAPDGYGRIHACVS